MPSRSVDFGQGVPGALARPWVRYFYRRVGLLTLENTLLLLGLCCVCLLVGFSWRSRRWAPWLMLVSVVGLLGLMSYSIINLL